MIEIITEKKKGKKRKPHFTLKYYYMIGDADGNTSETVKLSEDNPFIERYVTLLQNLQPPNGYWGISLEPDRIFSSYEENQITKDDYNFLIRLMFAEWELKEYEEEGCEGEISEYFKTEQENEWADEFCEGVMADTEYSYLTFEGITLNYVDETGAKFGTKIVN